MKHKDDIQDELRNISPFLGKRLSGKQGYRVPENYFKQLPDELMKQAVYTQPGIVEETLEPKSSWWRLFVAIPLRYKTLAGLGLGLLLFMFNFLSNTKTNDSYHKLSQFSAVEVSQYLDDNMEDFEWEDLVEANIVSNQDINFEEGNQAEAELIDNYLEAVELELEEELENNSLFSI